MAKKPIIRLVLTRKSCPEGESNVSHSIPVFGFGMFAKIVIFYTDILTRKKGDMRSLFSKTSEKMNCKSILFKVTVAV